MIVLTRKIFLSELNTLWLRNSDGITANWAWCGRAIWRVYTVNRNYCITAKHLTVLMWCSVANEGHEVRLFWKKRKLTNITDCSGETTVNKFNENMYKLQDSDINALNCKNVSWTILISTSYIPANGRIFLQITHTRAVAIITVIVLHCEYL